MNRIKSILFLIVFWSGNAFNASGTGHDSARQLIYNKDWNFVENKGQLADQEGNLLSDIKYYGCQGGVTLYCKPGMISFVFTKVEKENEEQISEATGRRIGEKETVRERVGKTTSSRADLILLNSNPSAQIIALDQQEYYENFYLAHTTEEGITHVHTYKTITYKSIYPNIDLVLHAKEQGLKYEFVVYPGGKTSDIQIQWNGFQNIKKNKDFAIQYSCALGNMTESAPFVFVWADPCVRPGCVRPRTLFSEEGWTHGSAPTEEIPSHFILKNKIIGFSIGKYDKTKPLVIDPFLSWATYFGGDAFDAGNSVATDNSGNVYITGAAESQSGIATSGAFQTSFGGDNEDAFLAKFNTSGKILWATYYGGTGNDYAQAVAIDDSGNVCITGATSSASSIATNGAYQTSLMSGPNAFLAKFNSNGARQWATYFGGDNTEGIGVAADGSGNIYIAGGTESTSGIATQGAFQTSNGGPNENSFLAKFNNKGSIQWATYYGGSGGDGINSVVTDNSGNIYITGETGSLTNIATNGAYQTSNGGNDDAFLAKFSSNGTRLWATYYGGASSEDGIGIATDRDGNVFIVGQTFSTSGIATIGAYQSSNTGNGDAFLAKFNSSGNIIWATYYGGTEEDLGSNINIDDIGNIYAAGTTESRSGIATNRGYQTSFGGGNEDAFLAQFSNNGALLWGTYYGGADDDVGNGVVTDGTGNVYMTGYTESPSGIATGGAAFQTLIAGPQNGFLAKFNFKASNDAGIASIFNEVKNLCSGNENVNVQLHNYGNSQLDSVNIGWTVNGQLQKPFHWTGKLAPDSTITINVGSYVFTDNDDSIVKIGNFAYGIGKDTIISWTSKPNGLQDSVTSNDTSRFILAIIPLPSASKSPSQTICEYDSTRIGGPGLGNLSYSWTSNPGGYTSTYTFPIVAPLITTTYYETKTDNNTGCSVLDSVLINVNPAPSAITGLDKAICIGDTTIIGDTASKGFTYNWKSAPAGFSSTLSNPEISPASATSYTLTETNTKTGCTHSDSVQINVNPLPVANVGLASYSICNGTNIKIGANAQPGITYLWSSTPQGFSSSLSNPVVDPGAYTQYYLTVTDTATGCMNKNFANVEVSILKAPIVEVGKNQAVCVGVSAQIGAIPVVGYSYSWTSNPAGFTSTSSEPLVSPLVTSSYSLTVTDVHGCTNFDSVTITVNPRPHPNAGTPQNVCSGTSIQLGEPNDTSHKYLWASEPKGFQSIISDPVDSPKTSTEYYLKETISATGCADSDSVKITVVPRPNSAFDVKNINGFGYQFIIQNPNYPGRQYHWNFGDTANAITDTASGQKVFHTYSLNGTYPVILTISLPGFCTEIDSYRVVIKESASFNIYPNPFGLQTDIQYVLLNPGHVKITMTDEIGRFIGTLADKQLSPGEYVTIFNAGAWKTRPAVYFIIFQLDDDVTVKPIIQIDSIYY